MLIHQLRDNETDLLKDFLYEAIFIPEGVEPPAGEIIEHPELKIYYQDFDETPSFAISLYKEYRG